MSQRRLILFTDAGFGSLVGSHSIEGTVIVLATVTGRGGVRNCHGYLLDHRCAKIQRVCKSSLAAEAHAALNAADQALLFQGLLTEIVTGIYDISKISPPTTYPLPDPYGPSPTDQEVTAQMKTSPLEKQTMFMKCTACQTSINAHQIILAASKEWTQCNHRRASLILFRPLVLTDCCSLFSAILRSRPRSQDKCAKLLMNQLRDLQTLIDMSYIDNSCNLGDMETKHAASLNILTQFFSTGKFVISFLGRKARSTLTKHTAEAA